MARYKEFNPSESLEKARNLFWQQGYYATSIEHLVKKMKINRGSMYDTYGNKRDLFISSLLDYAQATFREYQQLIVKDKSPLATIKDIVHVAIERSFKEGKACMLVKSSFELVVKDDDICDILQKCHNELVAIFEDLLIEAQKASEISPNKEPKILAEFIVASFAGFWQMQMLFNDKQQVEQLSFILFSILI